MTPNQCSLVITSLWIRVALACAQASAFRLPRFLPYVLVMLAGATYLCLRSPLYPPARPPPSASRQSSSMAMAKNGRPPALLPLSLSSRHPVYGVSVSEATRQLYGWDVILEAGADIQLTVENARPGPCMCIIGVEFDDLHSVSGFSGGGWVTDLSRPSVAVGQARSMRGSWPRITGRCSSEGTAPLRATRR